MKKKLIALTLAIVMSMCALASCGGSSELSGDDIIGAAKSYLGNNAYSATATLTLDTKNAELSEKLQSAYPTVISYSVNGDDFTANMQVTVDSYSVSKEYIAKGGVLYNESTVKIGAQETVIRKKTELNSKDMSAILTDLGTGAEIDFSDFENFDIEGDEDNCTITCTNLNVYSNIGASKVIGAFLNEADTQLTVAKAQLVIYIKDGRYSKTVLTFDYYVGTGSDAFKMSSTITTVYDYTGAPTISAPANADLYTTVDYDNALN